MSVVRIVHLSDPHFGTIPEGVTEGLRETLKGLKADLILISGDITQRARRKQFEAARAFMESLKPTPRFAVPGNHDIPLFNLFGRFTNPYRGYHAHFQDKRETDLLIGDVRVVGLNSTSRWRRVQGALKIPRIEEPLLQNWKTAQVRIVAVHHPLDCAKRVDDKNLLRGREAAFQLFERAEIDLVVSGHVHDPFTTLSNARYPESKRAMILSVAGTCLSRRTRKGAPNSFQVIEVTTGDKNRIKITRMDRGSDFLFRPRQDQTCLFERESGRGWQRLIH